MVSQPSPWRSSYLEGRIVIPLTGLYMYFHWRSSYLEGRIVIPLTGLYMYYHWRSSYLEGRIEIPLTGLYLNNWISNGNTCINQLMVSQSSPLNITDLVKMYFFRWFSDIYTCM
jgi:hypothetical protein